MYFRLDPSSPVPLYSQLIEQIRLAIVSGVIQPGDRLPGIRELAESEAINPMTVVKAYNTLVQEGLLLGKRGQGTFACEQNSPGITKRERRRIVSKTAEELVAKALQLGLSRDDVLQIVLELFDQISSGRKPWLPRK